jgi:hypothetical protein
MADMSDPLDVMSSRVESVRFKARKLRADAATLIARAEELEELSHTLEGDVHDVRKWAPKPANEQATGKPPPEK